MLAMCTPGKHQKARHRAKRHRDCTGSEAEGMLRALTHVPIAAGRVPDSFVRFRYTSSSAAMRAGHFSGKVPLRSVLCRWHRSGHISIIAVDACFIGYAIIVAGCRGDPSCTRETIISLI